MNKTNVVCNSSACHNMLLCKVHLQTYCYAYLLYKLIQKEFEGVESSEDNCLYVIFLRTLQCKLFFNGVIDDGHARFAMTLARKIFSRVDYEYFFHTSIHGGDFFRELQSFLVDNFLKKRNVNGVCNYFTERGWEHM